MLSSATEIMMVILGVVCVVSKTILDCVLESNISTSSISPCELGKACTQLARVLSPYFSPVAQHMTYCPHGQDKMSDQSISRRGGDLFVWFLAHSSGVELLIVSGD